LEVSDQLHDYVFYLQGMSPQYQNAYRLLVGKPKGKRLPGRPRRRWEHIRMDLGEVGEMNWIGLAQDRDRWRALANVVMNLQGL
jgi:hypothetical protein